MPSGSMQGAEQLHVGFQRPAGLSIREVAHIVAQPATRPAGDGFRHILPAQQCQHGRAVLA